MSAATPSDDATLVPRIRAGDEAAFKELLAYYHERLIAFADRYVRSRDVAADTVQHVFLTLWIDHATFAPRTTLAAYLYRAVWHRAQHELRHARIERRYELHVTAEHAVAPFVATHAGDESVEAGETLAAINRLLAGMTPRVREIFLMSRVDGLSAPQIAETLGIGVQVVYNQLSRAAKTLAEGLDLPD